VTGEDAECEGSPDLLRRDSAGQLVVTAIAQSGLNTDVSHWRRHLPLVGFRWSEERI